MIGGVERRAAALSASARRRVLTTALVLVVVAAVGVGWLGWVALRDAAAEQTRVEALEAAMTRTEQVLSYDTKTLDADLSRAREQVSGGFAAQYESMVQGLIRPAAQAEQIATKADVVRAAVISSGPEQMEAVLYINQVTTAASNPEPINGTNQVRVTMTRTDDKWLISELTPV